MRFRILLYVFPGIDQMQTPGANDAQNLFRELTLMNAYLRADRPFRHPMQKAIAKPVFQLPIGTHSFWTL